MSMTVWAVRIIGFIVAVVGLLLFLAAVGLSTGVHIPVVWWIEAGFGLLCIGIGVIIITGGKITA